LVFSVIGQTLGLRERTGETTEETLASYLNQRKVLLVLDNLEHLLDAAPGAGKLLAAAPNLSLLVTSREPLRLAGERLVDGVRSYRDVTAIPARDAFPDRFLKITQSMCFGDSGGPLFHESTVIGINTWTFSLRCSGPNFAYRVDSTAARTFLEANL
jgi:hypothetical protein